MFTSEIIISSHLNRLFDRERVRKYERVTRSHVSESDEIRPTRIRNASHIAPTKKLQNKGQVLPNTNTKYSCFRAECTNLIVGYKLIVAYSELHIQSMQQFFLLLSEVLHASQRPQMASLCAISAINRSYHNISLATQNIRISLFISYTIIYSFAVTSLTFVRRLFDRLCGKRL